MSEIACNALGCIHNSEDRHLPTCTKKYVVLSVASPEAFHNKVFFQCIDYKKRADNVEDK